MIYSIIYMRNKKKSIIFAVTFAVIIGFSAWFIYRDLNYGSSTSIVGIEEAGPALDAAACPIDSEEAACKMPDLDKEFVINSDLPASQRLKLMSALKDVRAGLKEDPDELQNWLQLGLLYKAIEDYESAEEAWLYATAIRPNDAVAFHNLGDLYAFYLPASQRGEPDFPKAEIYYRKAIEINPTPFFYQKLYEFYFYSYNEKADLAEGVLREGIEKNPGDELLPYLLEQHINN